MAEITPEPEVSPETVGITGVSASLGTTEITCRDEITSDLMLVTLVSPAETGGMSPGLEITLEEGTTLALQTATDLSLREERGTGPHLATLQTKEIALADLNLETTLGTTPTGATPEIDLEADPMNLLRDTPETGLLPVPEITLETEINLRR